MDLTLVIFWQNIFPILEGSARTLDTFLVGPAGHGPRSVPSLAFLLPQTWPAWVMKQWASWGALPPNTHGQATPYWGGCRPGPLPASAPSGAQALAQLLEETLTQTH